jgi:hypothetical protein
MNLTSTSDEVFNTDVGRIVDETNEHEEDWHIDTPRWTKIIPFWDKWSTAYAVYLDPKKRSPQVTEDKNNAREGLTPLMRKWIDYLRGNEYVTDDDEKRLGIFEYPHTNVPIPTTDKVPEIRVELGVIRRVTGHMYIANSNSKGKPDGVNAIEMAWSILDEDPESVDDLIHKNLDLHTRTSFVLDFDQRERGKRVYMVARYVMNSSRSGYGPWGEITYAIIP